MAALIPILFSGVLLAASPSPGTENNNPPANNSQNQPELTDAQAFSIAAGRILGAASACDQIDRGRVSTAATKAAVITAGFATSQDELSTAKELMKASVDMGRRAVQAGKADCKIVETAFGKLEQIERHQPGEDNQEPGQQDQ